MNVMGALDPYILTKSKNGGTMCNELDKRKICGKLKGRTWADGTPQRCYIPKEEA